MENLLAYTFPNSKLNIPPSANFAHTTLVSYIAYFSLPLQHSEIKLVT